MDDKALKPQELDIELIVAEPVCSRGDMETAKIVEQGIVMSEIEGILEATEFLKSKKINPDVVERVLWRPSERRDYSFKR